MLTQYYTFREACAALKISTNTLRARIAAGEITARKVGGQWRFTEKDLARPAERHDGIDASPTLIPLASARRQKPAPPRKGEKSFRERMKEIGYI